MQDGLTSGQLGPKPGAELALEEHEEFGHFGLLQALTAAKAFDHAHLGTQWTEMFLDLIEKAENFRIPLPKQVLILRVVKGILCSARDMPDQTKKELIQRLQKIIGQRALMRVTDLSMENEEFLKNHENYVSLQVPLSGTHSTTVAEHCISIMRALYGLHDWKSVLDANTLTPLAFLPIFLVFQLNNDRVNVFLMGYLSN